MEDYTKTQEVVSKPDDWAPISLPFEFPEKYKDTKLFTINDIARCVEVFFSFKTTSKSKIRPSLTGEGTDTNVYNNSSYGESAVKKYISRQLENEPCKKDSKGRNSTKRYSQEIVEKLFNNYEFQVHFLKVSIEWNKNRPNAEADLKKAEEQLKRLQGSSEQRKMYISDCIASFDRDILDKDNDIESKSILWLQKIKKRILFQFLFDSLIELNEDLLHEDIAHLLNIEDELGVTDREIQAALRFKDLHNYYVGRIDLCKLFEEIVQGSRKVPNTE